MSVKLRRTVREGDRDGYRDTENASDRERERDGWGVVVIVVLI